MTISPTRTSGHPFIDCIQRYYQGCNTADYELMMSTFANDVAHYFVDHEPVRGAEQLANYWCKVAPKTQANWQLDHALVQDPEAVIEWSMRWTTPQGDQQVLRGSEWYLFERGLIKEIRSYHNNVFLQDARNRALWGFDYASRGYRQET